MPVLPIPYYEARRTLPGVVSTIIANFGTQADPELLLWYFEWHLKVRMPDIDISNPRELLQAIMDGDLAPPPEYFIGTAEERATARIGDLHVTLNAKDHQGKVHSYTVSPVPKIVKDEVLAYCEAEIEAELQAIESGEDDANLPVAYSGHPALSLEDTNTLDPDLTHTRLISALTRDDWSGAAALLGILHQIVKAGRMPQALKDAKALGGFRLACRKQGLGDPLPALCRDCSGGGCDVCGKTGMMQ